MRQVTAAERLLQDCPLRALGQQQRWRQDLERPLLRLLLHHLGLLLLLLQVR
jgi:hypothetical protein